MRRLAPGILAALALAGVGPAAQAAPVTSTVPAVAPAPEAPAPAPEAVKPRMMCAVPNPTGAAPSAVEGGLHDMTPVRIADTRFTTGTVGAGCVLMVSTGGMAPDTATAVALTVTAVSDAPGYVTAYPCEAARPLASTVNTRPGEPVPNSAIVPVQASKTICFFAAVATDIVVDLTGWFGIDGEPFHGLSPVRALDTRTTATTRVAAGSVTRLPLAGDGLPAPAGARAVAANITVAETSGAGYVTAYPCSGTRPLASTVNFGPSDIRSNQTLVGLSSGGELCLFSTHEAALIVDVTGWFGGDDGGRLVPVVGKRVLDTRDEGGIVAAGTTRTVDLSRVGAPGVGRNVALNVTVTDATSAGFVTVFPCGGQQPASSSVNFAPGLVVPNTVVLPAGSKGTVCVYAAADAHVVVDVMGWLGTPGPLVSLTVNGQDLLPAYTPAGHNYGVICSKDAGNVWQVGADAINGATVKVNDVAPGTLTIDKDALATVTVTYAGKTTTAYVRCLPSNFPRYQSAQRDLVAPGYYVWGSLQQNSYRIISDERGGVVWYRSAAEGTADIKVLKSGNLAWTWQLGPTYGTRADGAYVEENVVGGEVRRWKTVGTPTDHHDLQQLPNGNMLLISYHERSGVDVSALGAGYPTSANVVDCWLQEINAQGAVVWEWHSEDRIGVAETVVQKDAPALVLATDYAGNAVQPAVYDLIHANSVDVVEDGTGDIIVSARHMDAVFRVSRATGKIVWKLGGSAPADPATIHLSVVGDPLAGVYRQHDARLLKDGKTLTVFDNETRRAATASSRGVEYTIDTAAGTATMTGQWTYETAGGQAFGLGSMRRTEDGGTVVGWGGLPMVMSEWLPNRSSATSNGSSGKPASALRNGSVYSYRVIKVPKSTWSEATLRAAAHS